MTSNQAARRALPRVLVALIALSAACTSDGCGCAGYVPGAYPADRAATTSPRGAQVRVTPEGLDFVEQNIGSIIDRALPGGLNFCLPRSTGSDTEYCFPYVANQGGRQPLCADGVTAGCPIALSVESATIEPAPPDTLLVRTQIADINPTIPFKATRRILFVPITLRCDVTLHKSGASTDTPATIPATIPIRLTTDRASPLRDVRVDIGQIDVDLSDVGYALDGGATCTVAGWFTGLLAGTFEDTIKAQLGAASQAIASQALCTSCGAGQPACPQGSACGAEAICVRPDASCVPRPLGLEGRLELGALLGTYLTDPSSSVHMVAKVADELEVDQGVTLAVRTGFDPVATSRCVPAEQAGPRPPTVSPPYSPTLLSGRRPGGEAFMVGLALHRSALESALWSAWASGATCLRVNSALSSQLSTQALGLLLGSVSTLAEDEARDVEALIVPQSAPTVRLGANVVTDGRVESGLIELDWPDLDIHLYAWIQDRYTRLVTARFDLDGLSIAVVPSAEGKIGVILGNVEGAITNVRTANSEILAEDPSAIAALLPTLVGLALPSLAGALEQGFALPEFFGLRLELGPDDIASVDNDEYLAIFADFVPSEMIASRGAAPRARIESAALRYPEPTAGRLVRPRASIAVGAEWAAPAQIAATLEAEYSWRVNGGPWSAPRRDRGWTIDDPLLALQGAHRLEVRARQPKGRWGPIAESELLVDYEPPRLRLERRGEQAVWSASDATDAPGELRTRWRLHANGLAGAWSAWGATSSLEIEEIKRPDQATRLEVEAIDRAGRRTGASLQLASTEPQASGDQAAAGGCASGRGRAPSAPWGLAALCLLGVVGARRRRRAALAALAALALVACSVDTAGPRSLVPVDDACAACGADEVCRMGTCVEKRGPCVSDDDCAAACPAAGGSCSEGACLCNVSCPESCAAGQICCPTVGSCQAEPGACDGVTCAAGKEPVVESAGAFDQASCSLEGASCVCRALEPLALGIFGVEPQLAQGPEATIATVYNQTYGDLMFTELDGTEPGPWIFVDGVPEGVAPSAAEEGPRGGVAAPGPDAGRYHDVVLDPSGLAHLFYLVRDEDAEALHYARGEKQGDSWSFVTQKIDEQGQPGYWPRAVWRDGSIELVYTAVRVEGAQGAPISELRHRTIDPGAAIDEAAGPITVLDTGRGLDPCGAPCPSGEVCLAASGSCAVPDADPIASCGAQGCAAGQACVLEACADVFNRSAPAGPAHHVGAYTSLSATPAGLIAVYYDGAQGGLSYIEGGEAGWGTPRPIEGSGTYGTAWAGAEGGIELAYMDDLLSALVFERVGEPGSREVIADGLRTEREGWILQRIGEGVRGRSGAGGEPIVLYTDQTLHRVVIARRDGGAWTRTIVGDGAPGVRGLGAALGEALVATFVIEYGRAGGVGYPVFSSIL